MFFEQKIDFCFEEVIGKSGIKRSDFLGKFEKFEKYSNNIANSNLELYDFSNLSKKVANTKKICDNIKNNFKKLYVLGTGGASLTGQTICGLLEKRRKARRIIFVDNVDPISITRIIKEIDFENSHILVISKSGGTIETVAQLLLFIQVFEEKFGKDNIKKHFTAITETTKKNVIKNICDNYKIKTHQHENVGGRFSIFSSIALVPAYFAGLDIEKFLIGASNYFDNFKNDTSKNNAFLGAILNSCFTEKNIATTVLMPYIERLKNFTVWYCQIWAESLGKTDKAITPIRALGTIDQHSQQQLFLQGKKDKIYTIIINKSDKEFTKFSLAKKFPEIAFLENKNMQDIMNIAGFSTAETLKQNNLPVRVIETNNLDEEVLGALAMHFILETTLMAEYLKINAYDQPAVEQGKKIAIKMLQK
jgi:glucose-6-phosphate isomerase